MSNIDKRAQKELYAKVEQQAHSLRGSPREYQALTGLCPVNVIEMHAQKIQALLDELEASDNNLIDSECHVAELEEALRDKQALLEASEQRIAELEALTAPQLPPPSPVSVPEVVGWEDVPEEITEDDIALASAWAHGFNQCRAAMLNSFGNSDQLDEVGSWNNHRNTPTAQDGNHTEKNLDMVDHFGDATQKAMLHSPEPVTDNTNQQFESLSRVAK